MTCHCQGVEPGTYANQEPRLLPFATPRFPVAGTKPVYIDRCVLPDVEALWSAGIETIESCCGHGRTEGYIAVPVEHEQAMLALGYARDERTKAPGCFLWPRDSGIARTSCAVLREGEE